MSKRQFGLIYISSYQARLFIVDLKKLAIIEQLSSVQFVQGGKKFEVYENELPRLTDALIGFKRKIAEYGIDNYKVYGNRQLLDKISARYLADQIKVRTGLEIEWLNGAQIAYYKIIAGMALPQFSELADDEFTYLLSMGSAMLNLTLFKGQHYLSTWNFALGPEEIEEMAAMTRDTPSDPIDIIGDYISRKLVSFKTIEKPTGKARIIIQHVFGRGEQSLRPQEKARVIDLKQFAGVYSDFREAPDQYLMEKYELDTDSLARMKPTIVLINQLVKIIKPHMMTLTQSSAITGLMIQEAARLKYRPDEYSTIVLTATKNIARRYESGGQHVNLSNKFALHIFDRLAHAGMVDRRDRQLLE
ncbi:exopolyphosphatase, partial [Lactobacillus delbrueckii subsp. bulgaricus]|nr:exopolyphosphatase [Lactobacillus delbrueckii subsp. bulgaricus]